MHTPGTTVFGSGRQRHQDRKASVDYTRPLEKRFAENQQDSSRVEIPWAQKPREINDLSLIPTQLPSIHENPS